jgi:hypothetical protein
MPRVFLSLISFIFWHLGRDSLVCWQGLFWYVAGMSGYTGCTGHIRVLERYHERIMANDGTNWYARSMTSGSRRLCDGTVELSS